MSPAPSPSLLPRRLRRVFRRLTQALERRLPAEDPARLESDAGEYWSGSSRDDRVRELSHWRGKGRWASAEEWDRVGLSHLEMCRRFFSSEGRPAPETVLEWGPGGGANVVHFLGWARRYIGVDISAANLEECRRQTAERQLSEFVPIHIEANAPEAVLEKTPGPCDLFLSTAVFQHFPSREYGIRITGIARKLLKPDGLALIQIRYDNGQPSFFAKRRDYRRNVLTFTSYRIDEFWNIAREAGFDPACVTLEPRTNYAFFFLRNTGETR